MSKTLKEKVDEVPFNCIIEDQFVISLLELDFDIMIEISNEVIKSIYNLPVTDGEVLYGGVCNYKEEEIFYVISFDRLDNDNVYILDFELTDLETYLDYIMENKTIKKLTNGSI